MQAGATLYITKSEVNPLLMERFIRYAIELKRVEQERTHILESIQDGFLALDKNWRFVFINQRAAQNVGVKPEELSGRNIWEAFPKLVGTPIEKHYRSVMEERKAVKFETQGVYLKTWYDVTVYPFKEGISVYWQDITERKHAEEAQQEIARRLELDRARLAAVLENLPVGIWITDQQGKIIEKNEQADRIWAGDAPLSDSIEKYQEYKAWFAGSGKLLQPGDYPVSQALQKGQPVEPVELNIQRFDGTQGTVLVSAVPIKDNEGVLTGVVGVNVDITERKRMENDLRFSEQSFSKAFNASPKAMVLSRLADGRIDMINDAYERQFGYTREDLIGKTCLELNMTLNPAEWEEKAHPVRTDHSLRSWERDIRNKAGDVWRATLSVETLKIGEEDFIITIFEDIL
jgi:PAS domain S-box-containing protein